MSSAEDALIRINRSVKGLNLFKNFKNIFQVYLNFVFASAQPSCVTYDIQCQA